MDSSKSGTLPSEPRRLGRVARAPLASAVVAVAVAVDDISSDDEDEEEEDASGHDAPRASGGGTTTSGTATPGCCCGSHDAGYALFARNAVEMLCLLSWLNSIDDDTAGSCSRPVEALWCSVGAIVIPGTSW